MYRCRYCKQLVYADERRTHSCKQEHGPVRLTGNEEDDFEYIPDPQRSSRNFFQECSAVAVERIRSMISSSLSPHDQPSVQENGRPRQQLRFPIVFCPTIIVPVNKPASLGNRVRSSTATQTENIPLGNSAAAGVSGSKQGAEKYFGESPKTATKESATKLLIKRTCRSLKLEIIQPSASSNEPPIITAEDAARESVRGMRVRVTPLPNVPPTPMETKPLSNRCVSSTESSRLPSSQENRGQLPTSGGSRASKRSAERPPETPQGASTSRRRPKLGSSLTYYCRPCQTNFATYENLDQHIERLIEEGAPNAMAHHHSPDYRREGFFVCVTCQERFDTRSELNVHSETHVVHAPHRCLHCKKEYNCEGFLSHHEDTKHLNESIYRCQYCKKRFRTETELINHHCEARN